MTNGEKFQTAEDRAKAFDKFCIGKDCGSCALSVKVQVSSRVCEYGWLDLEAEEEEQLPCPFCGSTDVVIQDVGGFELACQGCGFHTPSYMVLEQLISEYQRVARAVMDAQKGK